MSLISICKLMFSISISISISLRKLSRGPDHCQHSSQQPCETRYLTRTAFTEGLRLRLVNGGRHLGLDIDPRAWSGISFRKGSLQTAADNGTPGYALADMADHTTVDMTRRNYLGDTVSGRAARTAAIGGGFLGVRPLDAAPASLAEPPASQRHG